MGRMRATWRRRGPKQGRDPHEGALNLRLQHECAMYAFFTRFFTAIVTL